MQTMATFKFPQNSCIQLRSSLLRQKTQYLQRASNLVAVNDVNLRLKETRVAPKICHAISSNQESHAVLAKNKNPIIVIDNHDIFIKNLCQCMEKLGCNFEVYHNDELTVDKLRNKNPRGILISPGPGAPQNSGISLQTVLELGPEVPLFSIGMGFQCIGEAFGGKIMHYPFDYMHENNIQVYHNEDGEDSLFAGISNPFTVDRYHSLVIEKESFPNDALEITAWIEDGPIMAARHKVYRHLQGVQFHPHATLTTEGMKIVGNFIKLIETREAGSEDGVFDFFK